MDSPHPRAKRVGLSAAVLAFAVIALLVNVPVPTQAVTPVATSHVQPAVGTSYSVTWNNVDVSTAGSSSSALALDLSQTASLVYSWSTGSAATVTINDARLQMFYFGYAVSSRDQVISNPVASTSGSIPLSWAPVSVAFVLEGVYRLTASFLAPNGTTMWTENFYVRGTAPLGFVALIPIVLLLIVVYEIYGLVRSGRYAALGRRSSTPPPVSPPGPTPSSVTPAPTPSSETPAPTEPPAGSTPPSGGGS